MKNKKVFVEINQEGKAIRIVKGKPWGLSDESRRYVWRALAVKEIRDQVYERSEHNCEYCGDIITKSFHMHEKLHRGKGGEISLENSVAICSKCHMKEHKNRKVRFGEYA